MTEHETHAVEPGDVNRLNIDRPLSRKEEPPPLPDETEEPSVVFPDHTPTH